MEVCRGQRFGAAVSEAVLLEARVNIAEKFGDAELARFYRQLAHLYPDVIEPPSLATLRRCVPLTAEKDAHVLVAALECDAEYLLTLDRRHLLNERVVGARLPVRLMTPGDFLQGVARQP
jgi:predicted nucleic acid-binding protein